jgi:hypothetical protein
MYGYDNRILYDDSKIDTEAYFLILIGNVNEKLIINAIVKYANRCNFLTNLLKSLIRLKRQHYDFYYNFRKMISKLGSWW